MFFLFVRFLYLALLRLVAYKNTASKKLEVFVRGNFSVLVLGFLTSTLALANDRLPDCNDLRGNAMTVDNERVIKLKTTTRNQYKDRAYITGVLVGVLKERKTHLHLDVFIGETQSGRGNESDIEIIHNKAFGSVPGNQLRPGMEVSACGDFINAFDQAGKYPPSPVGAIIHWTHMAPRPGHEGGFIAVDGRLYGQNDPQDRGGSRRRDRDDNDGEEMLLSFWKMAI